MKFRILFHKVITIFLTALTLTVLNTYQGLSQGINISGLEKTWESDNHLEFQYFKKTLKHLKRRNVNEIRIPVDLDHWINKSTKERSERFKRLVYKLNKFAHKKNVTIIWANFDHDLTYKNYKDRIKLIYKNWLTFLDYIEYNGDTHKSTYFEIINEPKIYPNEWYAASQVIIEKIRSVHPRARIIIGASNYNSIYELSRMEPLPQSNIIYSFHFYEPFIFTHQGTDWTGPQNSTLGIPFPYDSLSMPELSDKAKDTDGEINFRDYQLTGTLKAIVDKLHIVNEWQDRHNVEVWCTEYGVTKNADKVSRKKYLNKVGLALRFYDIRGFLWEYKGNFGVRELLFD